MGRILSLVVACAIAAVPAYIAGAYAVAPALASTANPVTTTAGAAKTTTNVAQTTTATTTASVTNSTTSSASVPTTGNGAPSGSHYNLNIIGVPKDKTADMNNNDGHRIFVQLINTTGSTAGDIIGHNFADISKVNTILLAPPLPGSGGSFQVLDANATDTNGAIFQLPFDVSTSSTVWARALGKPGGTADMTTCATVTVVDPLNPLQTIQEVVCSTTLTLTRSKNAKFQDVTKELLTINTGTALVGACTSTTVTLFDQCLQNYFWNYDNHGLKLLQLRFYPVSGGGG